MFLYLKKSQKAVRQVMDAIGEAGKVTVSEKNGCFDILTRCTKNVSSIRRQMSERARLGGAAQVRCSGVLLGRQYTGDWGYTRRQGGRQSECDEGQKGGGGSASSLSLQPQLSASLPAAKHLFIACPCFLLCVLLLISPVFCFLLSYVVPIPPPLPPPPSPTPRGSVLRITQFLH